MSNPILLLFAECGACVVVGAAPRHRPHAGRGLRRDDVMRHVSPGGGACDVTSGGGACDVTGRGDG